MSKQRPKDMTGQAGDQLHHPEVRRFLNRMPLFKLDERRSDRFEDMLAMLGFSEAANRKR